MPLRPPNALTMPTARPLRLAALLVAALLLAACGSPDEPATEPGTPDDGVDEGTDDDPADDGTDDGTDGDGTDDDGTDGDDTDGETDEDGTDDGETDVGALSFADCEADRYTVGYPEDWNTNRTDGALGACEIFHPGAIDVPDRPRDRDLHYAVSMYIDQVDLDDLDPGEAQGEVLEERETTVDGRRAVVVEYRSDGQGLVPEGERSTTWTIDLDGEILVATTSTVGQTDYGRDQRILERMVTQELTLHDDTIAQAAPIDGPATTQRSTQEPQPDPDTPMWVETVRVGHHGTFDRVTFELGGGGTPGWLIEYEDDPRSQGRGDPVDIAGDAVMRVSLRGIPYPSVPGVPPYEGPEQLQPERTEAIVEVIEDVLYEGYYDFFVGLDAERPYRLELLEDPTRVVIDYVLE